jgi:hypothetical protein
VASGLVKDLNGPICVLSSTNTPVQVEAFKGKWESVAIPGISSFNHAIAS